MKNKILEVSFDVQKRLKRVNKKLDRVEYKLRARFENLKLLSENNLDKVH